MKAILYIVAVVASGACALTTSRISPAPSTSSEPTSTTNNIFKTCVDNCKCTEKYLPGIVKVAECSKPLTISNSTFGVLNKRVIETISFEDVIINEIRNDAFADFELLEEVYFDRCRIGTIEQKALDTTKKATFTNCRFEDEPNLFAEKLEELTISDSRLVEVPDLNNLFVLRYLNLSGNYIKDIDVSVLAQVIDLEELILSNNQIVKLPATLFENNNALNLLVLDDNPLKYFYMNGSNNLETLSLKNCMLTYFDQRSTYELKQLSELNLANNMITKIDSNTFKYMTALSVFDISNNSLTKLQSNIFESNPDLQKIILSDNNLEILPSFTLKNEGYFKTDMFACRNCGLNYLSPDTFRNMPAIVYLDLSANQLTHVDNALDLGSLKILDLSYNNIDFIGNDTFENNLNLEEVNLSGNPLLTVSPSSFAMSRAIKKIDLSNAKLYKLWADNSTTLESLEILVASNNQLTTLTSEDFKVVPNLRSIDLHNNPLRFDEGLCRVFRYMEKAALYPIEYTEAVSKLENSLGDGINGFVHTDKWNEFRKLKCAENVMTTLDKIEDDYAAYDDRDEDEAEVEENYSYTDSKLVEESYDAIKEFENADPYILSITFVFVITALVVLTVSVTITLCVMKRKNALNMQKANLPRFKIPTWEHKQTKKHCGTVYRPLSEEFPGPVTPKVSRYEFLATPGVHSS